MSRTKTVTCPYCDTKREVDIDAELKKSIGTIFRSISAAPATQSKPKSVVVTCVNLKCRQEFKVPV